MEYPYPCAMATMEEVALDCLGGNQTTTPAATHAQSITIRRKKRSSTRRPSICGLLYILSTTLQRYPAPALLGLVRSPCSSKRRLPVGCSETTQTQNRSSTSSQSMEPHPKLDRLRHSATSPGAAESIFRVKRQEESSEASSDDAGPWHAWMPSASPSDCAVVTDYSCCPRPTSSIVDRVWQL